MPDNFERIFLHCSDSEFGTAIMINRWHIERGFKSIGYHAVIQNGYPSSDWHKNGIIIPFMEGAVESGREVDSDKWFEPFEIGAGVSGWNNKSFHICMIGKDKFSNKVLNNTLDVIRFYMKKFNIGVENILGHYEKEPNKTCPNIDMSIFRSHISENTLYGDVIKTNNEMPKIIINEKPENESLIFKILNIFLRKA